MNHNSIRIGALCALLLLGCDPGALTVYDVATLTCEPANRSGRRRAAVVFHYVPADVAPGRAAG